jgi:formamidopyrimidine-DNA glycosylase
VPELPEVETVVRSLAPRITGRRILNVEVRHRRITRFSSLDPEVELPGRVIRTVRRHGKFILAELDRGRLSIHLGMTGQLLFDREPGPYTRVVFTLEGLTLLYDDIRMFGSVECYTDAGRVAKLGPDALTVENAAELLRGRKAPIKAVLLNQSVFAGMGNIYADEALFRAAIHPRRRANTVSLERLERLVAAMGDILAEAIHARGSSVSDYVDAEGLPGSYQQKHQVYGRTGETCYRCGTTIRRIVVGGRGTHYCPRCQR